MEIICISLSGTMISGKKGVNVTFIRKLEKLFKRYSKRYKFIITVGGGYSNTLYVNSVRSIISNNSVLDQIGIGFTRINALVLKDLLSGLKMYPNVVTNMEELSMATSTSDIVIVGGLLPGVSTDAVCALACEVMNGKLLINASSMAYVYDRPPEEKGARRLERLTHQELLDLAYKYDSRVAKSNFIFDLFACKIAQRAGIEIRFVSDSIEDLDAVLQGKDHKGSTVK